MIKRFGLVALESTNVVMKLEKVMLEKSMSVRIIPVPKEITANCGLSIKFDLEELEDVKSVARESGIDGRYYIVEKQGLKKKIEEI